MSDRKVVPFRRRAPSPAEIAVYRQITRSSHPEMRQLLLPELFRHDRKPPGKQPD